MLEQLRRQSRSLIIWVLFGIIIAVFIISFGPQSSQISCASQAGYAVQVAGEEVSPASWRFGMNGMGGGDGRGAQERRTRVVDLLVEREILAQAAEEAGFRVSDDEVNAAIADGEFYFLGTRLDGERRYYRDGVFDYDYFKQFARSLGLGTVGGLIDEQRREILANRMRTLLTESTAVSRDELRARFIKRNTTVELQYAKFDVSAYERATALTRSDLDTYLEHHGDEVKARFEADERTYKDVGPQMEVRHIVVDAPAPAAAADGGAVAVPEGRTEARERAASALARIRSGADFAAVAREVSDDERTAKRGGYVGWKSAGSLGLGAEVSEAASDLEAGGVSGVVESDSGFHIVKVESRREGDLTYDDVKYEIARKLARPYYARLAARRDAERALERIQSGESFGDLFPSGDGATKTGSTGLEYGPIVPAQAGGDGAEATAGEDAPAADGASADEPVPEPVGIEPPTLETVGPVTRQSDYLAGIGRSEDLVRAAFSTLAAGEAADRVFEVGNAFVLAKLTAREEADMAEFDGSVQELRKSTLLEKSATTLHEWLRGRCQALAEAGDVSVNREYLLAEGATEDVAYSACQTLTLSDITMQVYSQTTPR